MRILRAPRKSQQLVCTQCGTDYPLDDVRWRCDCGGVLDIDHTPQFDRRQIGRRPASLWRYREALPLSDNASAISLGEGYTPLLQGRIGGVPVWLKQDHIFPSGSYKDRGAALLVSQLAGLGIKEVVEDSSGNAGAALGAYCARADIICTIYAPEGTSQAKLTQIRGYGARLERIAGDRQATTEAALAAAETTYYASHVWSPFFLHGVKTVAFEVWEQLGWDVPDTMVLPVGNGTLLLGAALGFDELLAAEQIERVPRLIGVQAEACAPLASAWAQGLTAPVVGNTSPTLAEGIAIAAPMRGEQILSTVRRTGGEILTVSEEEIAGAWRSWWRLGFALEPTAAATLAGLARYITTGDHAREIIVSSITGHGLKAIDSLANLL